MLPVSVIILRIASLLLPVWSALCYHSFNRCQSSPKTQKHFIPALLSALPANKHYVDTGLRHQSILWLRGWASLMLSECCLFNSPGLHRQDTEPQTAPDVKGHCGEIFFKLQALTSVSELMRHVLRFKINLWAVRYYVSPVCCWCSCC